MSNENGDAPKVEGAEIARTDGQAESAEPDRAAEEKGKRVATYLFPNVLLIVAALAIWSAVGLLWTLLSIVGANFAIYSLICKSDGNYEYAARNARVARILFWINFIVFAVFVLLVGWGFRIGLLR